MDDGDYAQIKYLRFHRITSVIVYAGWLFAGYMWPKTHTPPASSMFGCAICFLPALGLIWYPHVLEGSGYEGWEKKGWFRIPTDAALSVFLGWMLMLLPAGMLIFLRWKFPGTF